jgi:hypothetical protein
MRLCPTVSFAVVYPVTPRAIRFASTRATVFPSFFSRYAAVRPVIPPPRTATSTVTFSSRRGYSVSGVVATQNDALATPSSFTARRYPDWAELTRAQRAALLPPAVAIGSTLARLAAHDRPTASRRVTSACYEAGGSGGSHQEKSWDAVAPAGTRDASRNVGTSVPASRQEPCVFTRRAREAAFRLLYRLYTRS